jgi:hypothetical protein
MKMRLRITQCAVRNRDGILVRRLEEIGAYLLRQRSQLLDGGRAVDVRTRQQDLLLLLLQ